MNPSQFTQRPDLQNDPGYVGGEGQQYNSPLAAGDSEGITNGGNLFAGIPGVDPTLVGNTGQYAGSDMSQQLGYDQIMGSGNGGQQDPNLSLNDQYAVDNALTGGGGIAENPLGLDVSQQDMEDPLGLTNSDGSSSGFDSSDQGAYADGGSVSGGNNSLDVVQSVLDYGRNKYNVMGAGSQGQQATDTASGDEQAQQASQNSGAQGQMMPQAQATGQDFGIPSGANPNPQFRKGGSVPGVNHYGMKTQRFEDGAPVVDPSDDYADNPDASQAAIPDQAPAQAPAPQQSQGILDTIAPVDQNSPLNAAGGFAKLRQYLFGDAASAQEVAQAEQDARGDGGRSLGDGAIPEVNEDEAQRSPAQPQQTNAEDVVAAAAQKSPEQGWRVLQAYRRKYEMLRQSAAAASNHDANHAAVLATQAHMAVPDGYEVGFQTKGDGITATVSKDGKVVSTHPMSVQQFHDYMKGPSAGFDSVMEATPSRTMGQAIQPTQGEQGLAFKDRNDLASYAAQMFPFDRAKQSEYVASVMEKGGQQYPSAEKVASNRADAMRDVAGVRGAASVAASANRAGGQVGAAEANARGRVQAADVTGQHRENSADITGRHRENAADTTGRYRVQAADVTGQHRENSADISGTHRENAAGITAQGGIEREGVRQAGQNATQETRNAGNLAVQGSRNAGNADVATIRGDKGIEREGVRQAGQNTTQQTRNAGNAAVAGTRADAYRYGAEQRAGAQRYGADQRLAGTRDTNQTNLQRTDKNNQTSLQRGREKNASDFARAVQNPTGLPPTPQEFEERTGRPASDYATPGGTTQGQQAPAPQGNRPPPAPPVNQRQRNTVYSTPKGNLRWVGNGWVQP